MSHWRDIYERHTGAPRIGDRSDLYAETLRQIDWLEASADALELEVDALPAPELPERYRTQLELLARRHVESPNPGLWGSIQRIIYECYNLTCDEICAIELWRRSRPRAARAELMEP